MAAQNKQVRLTPHQKWVLNAILAMKDAGIYNIRNIRIVSGYPGPTEDAGAWATRICFSVEKALNIKLPNPVLLAQCAKEEGLLG